MRLALLLSLLIVACHPAVAEPLPAGAQKYAPLLAGKQREIWPDAPLPSFLGGQVEQESCITLTHPRCWSPYAELKTSREYGFGLGQTTTAYKADGSVLFDKQAELRATYRSLRGWTYDNRFDPAYQLIAIIEMDKGIFNRQRGAATPIDQVSFTLSAYNGGEGGVLQDRRYCANTKGCDPSRWTGNVEHTSLKQKAPQKGYGKSFFAINRDYVTAILNRRRLKYKELFNEP